MIRSALAELRIFWRSHSVWPFTKSPKRPSYKEINALIETLPKDYIGPKFWGSCIDYASNTISYIYIGDWVVMWGIKVDNFEIYRYVSGLSDRIEVCDWEPVLLVLEKMKLKRAEAIAKLKV